MRAERTGRLSGDRMRQIGAALEVAAPMLT